METLPDYSTDTELSALARSGCLATPTAEPDRCNFCGHPREPRTLVRITLYTGEKKVMCIICLNNLQAARTRLWF